MVLIDIASFEQDKCQQKNLFNLLFFLKLVPPIGAKYCTLSMVEHEPVEGERQKNGTRIYEDIIIIDVITPYNLVQQYLKQSRH